MNKSQIFLIWVVFMSSAVAIADESTGVMYNQIERDWPTEHGVAFHVNRFFESDLGGSTPLGECIVHCKISSEIKGLLQGDNQYLGSHRFELLSWGSDSNKRLSFEALTPLLWDFGPKHDKPTVSVVEFSASKKPSLRKLPLLPFIESQVAKSSVFVGRFPIGLSPDGRTFLCTEDGLLELKWPCLKKAIEFSSARKGKRFRLCGSPCVDFVLVESDGTAWAIFEDRTQEIPEADQFKRFFPVGSSRAPSLLLTASPNSLFELRRLADFSLVKRNVQTNPLLRKSVYVRGRQVIVRELELVDTEESDGLVSEVSSVGSLTLICGEKTHRIKIDASEFFGNPGKEKIKGKKHVGG